MREGEKRIEKILFYCAATSIMALLFISLFILKEGVPVIAKIGLKEFLLGHDWAPTEGSFGIFPMIMGSLLVTGGALLLGVPLGVACATFLAEIAPRKVSRIFRPGIELLAGIPSVVYGFFGLVVLVPLVRDYLGGPGFSFLVGSVILAVMILPTVISISEDAIRAVPREYKEGALALGASHWQAIRTVILPTAHSGIIAAVVLGIGRAIGETMVVVMVTGNAASLPDSLLSPLRTMTGNIALEMGYSAGEHRQALFATGIVLFLVIILLNSFANFMAKKAGE